MAFKHSKGLVTFLLVSSMLAIAMAHNNNPTRAQNWNYGYNHPYWHYKHPNNTDISKRIIVGGSSNWQFGVNYTDWAMNNGPFYLNDTLVFKYDAPVDNSSHAHNVYLLPDYWSYMRCDLRRARLIANATQGSGEGFEFRLRTWRPHFFVCGESNGIHCDQGMMKFVVRPIFHSNRY